MIRLHCSTPVSVATTNTDIGIGEFQIVIITNKISRANSSLNTIQIKCVITVINIIIINNMQAAFTKTPTAFPTSVCLKH